jgi:hypothetical protein
MPKENPQPKDKNKENIEAENQSSEEFNAFDNVASKLFQVPIEEVRELEIEEKKKEGKNKKGENE